MMKGHCHEPIQHARHAGSCERGKRDRRNKFAVHSRCRKLFYAPTSRSRTSVPRSESGSRRDGRHASVWASACRIRPLEDVSASPSPTAPQALPPATNKQRAKARVQGPTIRPGSEKKPFHPTLGEHGGKKDSTIEPAPSPPIRSATHRRRGGVLAVQVHRVPLLSEGSVLPWSAVSNEHRSYRKSP